jgi:hypothetical protein
VVTWALQGNSNLSATQALDKDLANNANLTPLFVGATKALKSPMPCPRPYPQTL